MPQEESKQGLFDGLVAVVLAIAILVAVIGAIVVVRDATAADRLKLATGYALLIFLFFLSIVVLLEIIRNKIDLSQMLEELSGGASMSRFQLLVFTFVIAFSLFLIVVNKGAFPDLPGNVLALLGVSASTYAVSKGLQIASGDVGTSSASDTGPKATEPKP
jgi:hypothetical protein